jgi:hypothetical protein
MHQHDRTGSNHLWLSALGLVLSLLSLAQAARAATGVAYDNFGPGYGTQQYGTWIGTRPGLDWNIDGTKVVPSQSGYVSNITLGMFMSSGVVANKFVLSVRADDSGHPGATLWEQTFENKLSVDSSAVPRPVAMLSNVGGPWLDAGQPYWFIADTASPKDGFTYHFWYSGMGPPTDAVAHTNEFFFPNWDVANNLTGRSIRVEVSDVPEPTLAGAAIVFFAVSLRRARARTLPGCRFNVTSTRGANASA